MNFPERERMGGLNAIERYGRFCGVFMQKAWEELFQIEVILNNLNPKRIIELGTGTGGTTLFLGLQGLTRGIHVHSYDIGSQNVEQQMPPYVELALAKLGVKYQECNIFEHIQDIGNLISLDGKSLLYCDAGGKEGGKVRFVEVFGQYLKSGDIVLVHDHYTNEYPKEEANRIASKFNLEPYEPQWMSGFNAKHGCYICR